MDGSGADNPGRPLFQATMSSAPLTHARDLLDDARLSGPADAALRGLRRHAAAAVLALVAAVGLWSAAAPLSGAVVAAGVVRTEHNRKVIQHQEGGLVRRVLVRDGQKVQAGELLAVVADVRSDAGLDLLRDQQAAERLRRARLEAESEGLASFGVPAELQGLPGMADLAGRERKVFASRRAALDEQLAALTRQAGESARQAEALQAQIDGTEQALKLAREELALNLQLVEQGYVQRTRVIGLQRVVAEYESRLGEQRGALAQSRQAAEDLQLRAAQARNAYRQQAVDELKDSALRLREVDERLRPSADLAERQNLRAPVAGTVMGLRVSAAGTAVGPREPLMELVPADERLIVEARIRPEDIDHVRLDGAAELRLSAYDPRVAPRVPARVVFVSPDRQSDAQTGAAWYTVHLQVDEPALRALPGLQLQTGMPAEVYLSTAPRSLLAYLLEPIDVFRQRALREP